ncbi:MAG: hypothetical protein MK100_07895 [Phycisphaerales bacterium]|nr:hypothetical protein [Phycisphaerales bacterium]
MSLRLSGTSRSLWAFENLEATPLPEDPRSLLGRMMDELESSVLAKSEGASSPATSGAVSGGDTISDSDLSELAIQTWRLEKRIKGLDPGEHKRIRKQLSDSVRRFKKILERFSVEFEDLTHRPFRSGWQEVEVVAWEEPEGKTSPVDSGPWVFDTMAPLVRRDGRAIKIAQVICVDVEEK